MQKIEIKNSMFIERPCQSILLSFFDLFLYISHSPFHDAFKFKFFLQIQKHDDDDVVVEIKSAIHKFCQL